MKLAIRLLTLITLFTSAWVVHAQDNYPNKPIRIVVPYSAGGGFDIYARALAADLAKAMNQAVIVDNRPGANEVIAASYVKGQPADGYTLYLATESGLVNNPILYSKLPYDPNNDFVPVTRLFDGQAAYVVRSAIGVNSTKEFVEYAKRMNGKASYGSSGTGGTTHLALAWLGENSKVQLIHAPYRGLGPALQDLLAGQIDAVLAPLALIEPHLGTGRIKPIAVTGHSRLPRLPDVPTVHETGEGTLDVTFYLGLVAPAGTPQGVVSKISTAVRGVACSQAFIDVNAKPFGYIPICDTPEEFRAFLKRDEVNRRDRIRATNVRLD